MVQPTSNNRMQRVLLAAVLMTGLFLFGASPEAVQEGCYLSGENLNAMSPEVLLTSTLTKEIGDRTYYTANPCTTVAKGGPGNRGLQLN